ncbi:MAG: hypothetical protein AAFQ21_04220 [Pseudomonadota bacterium]
MLLVALVIAAFCLIASAICFVGLPYAFMGAEGVRRALSGPEPRLIGGVVSTALAIIVLGPLGTAALISGTETVQVFASGMNGLTFGL